LAAVREAARQLRAKSVGAPDVSAAADVAAKAPAPSGPWASLAQPARASAVEDTLSYFVETVRLLKARAAFLASLGGSSQGTAPGFGRVDAFGGARNLIFAQSLPLDAPISYPHLWNLNQIVWLHWDANTTSLTERNVGQALGLGAIFDRDTGDSTVLIPNIEELEKLARKIAPPAWPAQALGDIDAAKSGRGRTLFEAKCVRCHKDLKAGDTTGDDKLPPGQLGTDPLRATNFARPVGGAEFNVALSQALKKVTRKAGGTVSDSNEWRVTGQYASRPLVASWATAPYLHNNSVPTIYHLLLPADQRPKTFPVGSREYDPVKLGYKIDAAGTPSSPFDTTQPGNSNSGHSGPEFGTDLKDDERMDLLEYLKTVR
jgi:hypothetical protein